MKFTEENVAASICKESFYDFVKEFWLVINNTPFVDNWHIKYLCEELQRMAERVFKLEEKEHDLLINIPPGSSKSTIASQMFEAWVWTRMPQAQFICCSYASTIALRDAVRMRDIVLSEKYQQMFPGITLRIDENTKGYFRNDHGGFRWSAGLDGQITGQHAHFILIDDPLNPKEALSEADRLNVNRVIQETLPSRKLRFKENVVPIILIQQRLHQGDPSGEMLERGKDGGVKHINLPAELTKEVSPPELAQFYVDGLLDPHRLNKVTLEEVEQNLGAYGYASQYLQTPVPRGGAMFDVEKLNRLDDLPDGLVWIGKVRAWDKAGTDGAGAWTVGTLQGKDKKGRYWILDVVRERLGSTKREKKIKDTAEADDIYTEVLLEQEPGSGGKESREGTVINLAGHRVHSDKPTGDKETRAYNFSVEVGRGNVYVLNRHWTEVWVDEHRFFPFSRFKDQVDSSSAGFNRLALKKVKKVGGLWRVQATAR